MGRERLPWNEMHSARSLALLLVGAGVVLAWFGDIVYWHEHGAGFFEQALQGGATHGSSPLVALGSHYVAVPLLVLLSITRFSGRTSWLSLGAFGLLTAGLAYLAYGTLHPIALVPALFLLGGVSLGWVVASRSRRTERVPDG